MATTKIYNSFSDKYGKTYSFPNYTEFSVFWFGLSRKAALLIFPDNFAQLQKAAANSKEAKTKVVF